MVWLLDVPGSVCEQGKKPQGPTRRPLQTLSRLTDPLPSLSLACVVPEAVRPGLINLLAQSFTAEEIDFLGKHLEPRFNAHMLSGEPFGMMLRPEQAARTIVNHFAQKDRLDGIILGLIQIAAHGDTSILGRRAEIPDFQSFMQRLGQMGLRYDADSNTLIAAQSQDELDTWGYIQEGQVCDFAFVSLDIAGNSKIQLKYPKEEIEFVYAQMLSMFRRTVGRFNGKVWSWAGDGGICAFYLGNHAQDAVECCLAIHFNMHLFNLDRQRNRFHEPVAIRIAVHEGSAAYKQDKGAIFSDAINFVAHMEKRATESGGLSISERVHGLIDPRLQRVFEPKGPFENINVYSAQLGFPWLSFDETPA